MSDLLRSPSSRLSSLFKLSFVLAQISAQLCRILVGRVSDSLLLCSIFEFRPRRYLRRRVALLTDASDSNTIP